MMRIEGGKIVILAATLCQPRPRGSRGKVLCLPDDLPRSLLWDQMLTLAIFFDRFFWVQVEMLLSQYLFETAL